MKPMMKIMAALSLATAAFANTLGGLSVEVRSNRADQRYPLGEEAVFNVLIKGEDGKPLSKGEVNVSLDAYGRATILATNTVDLSESNPFTVKGSLDKPGFLRLVLTSREKGFPSSQYVDYFMTSVAYEPEKITPSTECPKDFNEFWRKAKAEAAKIPLDAKIELDGKQSDEKWNVWRVSFATVAGRRVYGWLTKEKNATGKLPARVQIAAAGFGGYSQNPVRTPGHVTLFMTVFPFEPCRPDSKANYEKMQLALKAKYSNRSYPVAGLGAKDPKESFYYPVILGNDRAIAWLSKRDDVDARRITYSGTSQGGGLGFAAVALSGKFRKAAFHVPAMVDIIGAANGRYGAWPKPQQRISSEEAAANAVKNAPYYDGANFARNIRIPCFVTAGTSDSHCWAPSVWAAYNQINSKNKIIRTGFGMSHSCWPRYYAEAFGWLDDKEPVLKEPHKDHVTISHKPTAVSTDKNHWWQRAVKYRNDEAKRLRDAEVVWIGDSITHYYENADKKAIWDKWMGEKGEEPGFFAKFFGAKAKKAPYLGLNLGIEGDSTENVLYRLKALEHTCPRVIIVNIGTNNAGKRNETRERPEDTLRGLTKLLSSIRNMQPQAKVLVYAIFPRGKGVTDRCMIRNEMVNKGLEKLCRTYSMTFCDIREAFLNPDGTVNVKYLDDRLHPSPEGCELWMEDVVARVREIYSKWNDDVKKLVLMRDAILGK